MSSKPKMSPEARKEYREQLALENFKRKYQRRLEYITELAAQAPITVQVLNPYNEVQSLEAAINGGLDYYYAHYDPVIQPLIDLLKAVRFSRSKASFTLYLQSPAPKADFNPETFSFS